MEEKYVLLNVCWITNKSWEIQAAGKSSGLGFYVINHFHFSATFASKCNS